MRKRVLFVSEASNLSSGYGVYANQMLKRLYSSNKYDILEYGVYASELPSSELDPEGRYHNRTPWQFVGALPNNRHEEQIYKSSSINEFGGWKFDHVCANFKPHVVFDYRDIWMTTFVNMSPFRRKFKFIYMPAVDCEPQQEEWISYYSKCDYLLTYSKWAEEYLNKQAPGIINLVGQASPGADYSIFKPVASKKKHKQSVGIDPNSFIIGTIMRNQKRKLYPDLIEAFSKIDIPNCYLYLHTSYPDMGWDIPYFIKNSTKSHYILVTYKCQACGSVYPSVFNGPISICKRCGEHAAQMPSTNNGVSREELSGIINLFDFYAQIHNSEGFAMPIVEAAACGVVPCGTDYTAPSSILRDIEGYPIRVERYFWEPEKNCKNALPDMNHFIEIVNEFYNLSDVEKAKKSARVVKLAKQHYNYDKSAQHLTEIIDSINVVDTWGDPPDIMKPNLNYPKNINPDHLVQWAIINVLGRPEYLNSYLHLRMMRDLVYGSTTVPEGFIWWDDMSAVTHRPEYRPYRPEHMIKELSDMRENINRWENIRCSLA